MHINNTLLGLDLGTSGLRGCIVAGGTVIARVKAPLSGQRPAHWELALKQVLTRLRPHLGEVGHIVADATSSTVMLWKHGRALLPVRLYNETGHPAVVRHLKTLLPPHSGAQGASSTLAKVLRLKARHMNGHAFQLAHQIDWLNAWFLGHLPPTDWNNALKLGFDPITLTWPEQIRALLHPLSVPRVVAPGTPLGTIHRLRQQEWGFPAHCQVHAGTTDSIAAFLATGADRPGDGVTSLGSTLALKLLTATPLFASEYGIYSHRLGNLWLAGGASNCGGRTLLRYFTPEQLRQLTPRLHPDRPTGLDYYPLPEPGERFPISDPRLPPRIRPIPDDPARFLQGLLEGLTRVEQLGWEKLMKLSGTPVRRIFCAGGGCVNPAWRRLRQRMLPAPLAPAANEDAAFGVTRLLAAPLCADD